MRRAVLNGAMAALILAAQGCVTSGPRRVIVVSNSSGNEIADVAVESGGEKRYGVPALAAYTDGAPRPMGGVLAETLNVRWKTKDGTAVSRIVKAAKSLPRDFRGKVLLQIDDRSEVRFFVLPESEKEGSLIPWGSSGDFDGSVVIPGLNQ